MRTLPRPHVSAHRFNEEHSITRVLYTEGTHLKIAHMAVPGAKLCESCEDCAGIVISRGYVEWGWIFTIAERILMHFFYDRAIRVSSTGSEEVRINVVHVSSMS